MRNDILRSVPIDKLALAEDFRKAPGTVAEQHQLRASILNHGLLNPITVKPNGEDGYHVVAGARRFRALKDLIEKGEREDPEIPCVLYHDPEKSVEASLAENTARADMHPMDEADTFAHLLDAGLDEDAIANRFGIGVDRVKRRLKLASLAPEVKAAYREGELYLQHAREFTLSNDHARQVEVLDRWRKAEDWEKNPHHIRSWITSDTMRANHVCARYVGLKAYEKAGGTIVEDLFSDRGDDRSYWIEDAGLMSRLANEKLHRKAKTFKDKAAWVEAMFEFDHARFRDCERVEPDTEGAGVVLTLNYDAKVNVSWLIAPKAKGEDAQDGEEATAGPPPEVERRPAKAAEKERNKFSEAVRMDLHAWRGEVIADQLSDKLALKVLIYQMASLYFKARTSDYHDHHEGWGANKPVGVRIDPHRPGREPTEPEKARTGKLRLEWLEAREKGVPAHVASFEAFMQLSDREHNKLLAEVSRRCLQPGFYRKKRSTILQVLADGNEDLKIPGCELKGVRPPTAAGFWKRLSLPVIKDVAERYLGADWFSERAGLKKGALCVELEQAFKDRDDFLYPGWAKGAPDPNATVTVKVQA